MNEEKFLIIDKSKQNKDITKDVYKYKFHNYQYNIYFIKKKKKKYNYNISNLEVIENPILIKDDILIRTNYCVLSNIEKILKFTGIYKTYIKVFFKNNTSKLYCEDEISIEYNILDDDKNSSIFAYLNEMAANLKIDDIENTEKSNYKDKNFLKSVYEKMSFISDKSILTSFLLGKQRDDELPITNKFIYPFTFNLSQKEAISNAFNNHISVIEGPPGTGKTQTILNIIVNAILQNKTVAVLSNNNSATDNVFEKLEKEGLSHLAAKLGRSKNVDTFLEKQDLTFSYPQEWYLKDDDEETIKTNINKMNDDIEFYLNQRNEIAKIEQELNSLITEQDYFERHIKSNNQEILKNNSIHKFNSFKIKKFLTYLNSQENKREFFSNKIQLISQLKFKFLDFKLYRNDIEKIMQTLEYNYYKNRIKELKLELDNKNNNLLSLDLENTFKNYTQQSMEIFKSYIYKNYNKTKDFNWKELKQTELFTKTYPIILSTTYSLLNCISSNYLFDYIIVDESSQVDLVSSFPSLSLAKNIIVVGDSKQLPNIISNKQLILFNSIFDKYNIDNKYNYTKNNLLSLTKSLYEGIPCKVLQEHYRCHPKIIDFCNKKFYNDELIILSRNNTPNPIKQYKSVPGNHARMKNNSWYNDRQVEIIRNEIFPKENINIERDSVGVITPYKEHKKYLINKLNCDNISIDTVHGFQGREKDIIIFSTVTNEINKFLDNPNSINVAISRAINKLYLVTPDEYKSSDNSNISNLISYIAYNNFDIVKSKITSIFDMLYKVNEQQRISFFKKHLPIAKFPSEGIAFHTIRDVLSMSEYFTYDVRREYPLRLIVKDRSILTEEEISFIKSNSKLDFLVYNKFDKKPILAIEVDGYSFHNNSKQQIRDAKKDSILDKCKLKFLRLPTNECNEKDKIINALEEYIKTNV